MKWTIILTALGGLAAFALIFAAQTGHENSLDTTAALAAARDTDEEPSEVAGPLPPCGEEDPPIVALASPDPRPVAEENEASDPFDGRPWQAGVAAFQAGDYERAEAALERAVEERPEMAYRHYLLGLTYLRRDDPASAVEEFELAEERTPGDVRTLVNLARAYLGIEDPAAARRAVDAALEVDLDDADAWVQLGRVELASGNLEEGRQAFRNATLRAAEHAFAWNNLGYAHILDEQFTEAVPPLAEATRLRQDIPYFFNNLGVALERTGDLLAARRAYDRASELGHEHALASYERVDAVIVAHGEDAFVPAVAAESDSVVGEDLSAMADW